MVSARTATLKTTEPIFVRKARRDNESERKRKIGVNHRGTASMIPRLLPSAQSITRLRFCSAANEPCSPKNDRRRMKPKRKVKCNAARKLPRSADYTRAIRTISAVCTGSPARRQRWYSEYIAQQRRIATERGGKRDDDPPSLSPS